MKRLMTVAICILALVILLGTYQLVFSGAVATWFRISDIPALQDVPEIAYNPSSDQFLVVWEDFRGSSGFGSDVYAQLVNGDGSMSGVNFPLTVEADWQRAPKPAYNPVTDQYLVVWVDARDQDIYGLKVNGNGSLSGSPFPIAAALEYQWNPDLVYNSATNQFLVVFDDDRLVSFDHDIYGQLVNADGSLSGANFTISFPSTDQLLPVVAYNNLANQYLVVWQDDRNSATNADIYARVVNGNGSMSGADFAISTASSDQTRPDLAYAASANRFLVVWEESADIYGRLVNADKTFAGPEFMIASSSGSLSDPVVGFDPISKQFLVVWSDSIGWDNLYARLVDTNGMMAEPKFEFAYGTGNYWYPAIAFNSASHQFLVAWQHQTCHDSNCDDYDRDIYGAFYQATAHYGIYVPLLLQNFLAPQLPTATPITPSPTLTQTPTGTPILTSTPTPTPTNTPTPTPTSTPGAWETILTEDFEGSFPGAWWVVDNQAGYGEYYWDQRTCRAYSGSFSGWAVGGGADGGLLACGSNYPDNAKSWMIYGPFSLADATDAELSFKAWVNTESPSSMVDLFCWMASTDGTNFSGDCAWGNSSGWFDQVLDLSNVTDLGNLTGQPSVWVGLWFYSDGSVGYAEGAYVDDIILRKCTSGDCPAIASQLPGSYISGLYQFSMTKSLDNP
jgi:hypothetical protein